MRKRSLSRFLKPTQLNYEFVERFLVLLISVVFIIVNFSKKEEQRYIRNHVVDFFSPINIVFQIPGNQIKNLKDLYQLAVQEKDEETIEDCKIKINQICKKKYLL